MREMLDKKTDTVKFIAPASAFEGLELYYEEPMKVDCPENCIEIETENDYGWKNKVYILKDILCKK